PRPFHFGGISRSCDDRLYFAISGERQEVVHLRAFSIAIARLERAALANLILVFSIEGRNDQTAAPAPTAPMVPRKRRREIRSRLYFIQYAPGLRLEPGVDPVSATNQRLPSGTGTGRSDPRASIRI